MSSAQFQLRSSDDEAAVDPTSSGPPLISPLNNIILNSPNGQSQSHYVDRPSFQHEAATREDMARRRAMILFSITTVLLFADQNLMSPNLTAIAEELGMDEYERDRKLGGDISLAFFLLGAPASMLVGCLADQSDRSLLFAATVGIGELACLGTYFCQSYAQLYICRAITGFAVGGALPLIYSILGDLYMAQDRHVVSAVVSFGTGAGISVGQAIAGFLGPAFGWRLPFLVVAVPALICSACVFFFVKDPPRGGMEKAVLDLSSGEHDEGTSLMASTSQITTPSLDIPPSHGHRSPEDPHYVGNVEDEMLASESYAYSYYFGLKHWATHSRALIKLLSTKTVLLALIQGAPGCIPWGILNVFLNDYLSEDRGFSVEMATTVLMLFSLGFVGGLTVGGLGGRYLYQQDPRYPALLAGITAILGCFPFWMLLNNVDRTTPFPLVVVIAMLAGFGSGPTGPIIKATLTNVTMPRARGQAFALFNLFDDFGKGLGPYFVSVLISKMGGRRPAFNVGVFGWIICGVANLVIYCTVLRDEQSIQRNLVQQLEMSTSTERLHEMMESSSPNKDSLDRDPKKR